MPNDKCVTAGTIAPALRRGNTLRIVTSTAMPACANAA
jgi:hypothetical protein